MGGDELFPDPYSLAFRSLSEHGRIEVPQRNRSKAFSLGGEGREHFKGGFVTYHSALVSGRAFFSRVTLESAKGDTGKVQC